MHCGHTIAALESGKAVLCEKPLAMNAAEASQMIAKAREARLFLMEAMWTRFLPLHREVKRRVREGEIGEVRMITADFGFRVEFDPTNRLFAPELGGGALLDVGIYPLSLAHQHLGTPDRIHAEASFAPTGTDEQTAILLKYAGGQLATLTCGVRTRTYHEAVLCGTEGLIRVHPDWWSGNAFTIHRSNGIIDPIEVPTHANGFVYEIEEVGYCLAEGRLESDVMPLEASLSLSKTMDAVLNTI